MSNIECIDYLDFQSNFLESFFWMIISLFVLSGLDANNLMIHVTMKAEEIMLKAKKQRSFLQFIIDRLLSSLCLTFYMFDIFYKYQRNNIYEILNISSLTVLSQGIALALDNKFAVLLGLIQFPLSSFNSLNIIYPNTNSHNIGSSSDHNYTNNNGVISNIEITLYYLQHYTTLIIPLYMLLRHDFAVFKFYNLRIWLSFLFYIIAAHFIFYGNFDFITGANVQYMLCPGNINAALNNGIIINIKYIIDNYMPMFTYRTLILTCYSLMSFIMTQGYLQIVLSFASMIDSIRDQLDAMKTDEEVEETRNEKKKKKKKLKKKQRHKNEKKKVKKNE